LIQKYKLFHKKTSTDIAANSTKFAVDLQKFTKTKSAAQVPRFSLQSKIY